MYKMNMEETPFVRCYAVQIPMSPIQACNQLWTPGGGRFSEGVPNFLTISNSCKLCPTHFFQGGAKKFPGDFVPSSLRACSYQTYICRQRLV